MNEKKIEILEKVSKIVYLLPPSPVVLVSTVDKSGERNLAPFAMFMPCSSKPPMLALGISCKSDTFKNIIETKEFVVGIPCKEILKKLYLTGKKYLPEIDEFNKVGLSPYKSPILNTYRIKECPVNFDCELFFYKETGNHHIVVGKVLAADILEELFSSDKLILRKSIPRVYHFTSNFFLVDNIIKEVKE